MNPTFSAAAIGPIVAIVLAATGSPPTAPADTGIFVPPAAQARASPPGAPPILVAQGRCFNGRCY